MSTLPDNEFDLEKLFLPAWAQEPASAKYAHYEGTEERPDRRGDRRGPRPPRRDGPTPPRRDDRPPRRDDHRGPGRPEGERGRLGGGRVPARRPEPREHREPPPPLPELNVSLLPDEKGVESLARQIKMTGRAYPLFDIAQMILQKPERHAVVFSIKKNAEGKPVQPLFVCALDDTLWLSEEEAASHVLRKHFATFYQAQRTPKEPPKGTYTFVAQCGMSGVILGPPNHHDYQNQLRRLHGERFSRMPFEVFKARVRIVRDPEVVKKWVEDQSWRTEYDCLNLPEPLRLASMEEVEAHFRQTHKENIIKSVESHTLAGAAARGLRSQELLRLVRSVWEDQRRFPLQIATVLSQQFANHGLQFFKVNKTVTHVCVTRPHYLDLAAAPVSEGIRRIVEHLDAHNRCIRRHLVEALAPSPPPSPLVIPIPGPPAPAPEAPAPAPSPMPEATAPAPEGAATMTEAPAPTAEAAAPAASAAPAPSPQTDASQPTPEQTLVIADLHWLIHQGHVIEFANGVLETAKKPLPKPPKPEIKPRPQPAPAEATAAAAPGVSAGEGAATTSAAEPQEAAPAPAEAAEPAPETLPAAEAAPPEPQLPASPACALAAEPEPAPVAAEPIPDLPLTVPAPAELGPPPAPAGSPS